MQKRFLGNSDLEISRIGFGAWAAGGGGWQFGWGPQDDGQSVEALLQALDSGINWIDTAPVYGLGHSEEIVARALGEWKGTRPYIFTKCGMIWNDKKEIDYSLKPKSIRNEVENSLRRLRVETIDLYQIHWPADALEETIQGWTELAALQKEGKLRWIGASNFSLSELQTAHKISSVTSIQPPYSLLRRDIETEILPFCLKENIGVIVYSPMASGLLTGTMTAARVAGLPSTDWRTNNPEFKEPKLSRNLALVEKLKVVGQKYGRSPGEVAIAWTLNHSAVTGAIVGARSALQVAGFIHAPGIALTPEEFAFIGQLTPA